MRKVVSLVLITACVLSQAVSLLQARSEEVKSDIRYEFAIEMLDQAQAVQIYQKTTYRNKTDDDLTRIVFSLYPNAFRRESTLPYDNSRLEAAFPFGYAPGGIEFQRISVNGKDAEWGVQGSSETYLRVNADIPAGESAVIEFHYTLLLTENRAFLGASDIDWRLTAFYPSVCPYENGEFVTNPITRAGEFLYATPADFSGQIAVPEDYEVASGAAVEVSKAKLTGRVCLYDFHIENAREISFVISRKFHTVKGEAPDGTEIRVYGQDRIKMKSALAHAKDALSGSTRLIGDYVRKSLTIVLADIQNESVTSSGMILISKDSSEDLSESVPRLIFKQYFADLVMPNPSYEGWMAEAFSEYASLLLIEEAKGEGAFQKALNSRILPSLTITIPGNPVPHAPTSYFITQSDYVTVARERGAAVLHELRLAMGREKFISCLQAYCDAYLYKNPTAEDWISVMNDETGGQWDSAVYSWLNSISDYAGEYLETYD